MIIGVDLGNYAVKTSEKAYILSKVSEDLKSVNDEEKIIYQGKRLYLGEGQFQTDWDKSKKSNLLPLLTAALAKSSKESYFQVVLGLPIQQYKIKRNTLKSYIENNRIQSISIGDGTREIIITDVEVAPEGASAYYNLSEEKKSLIGTKQLLIIDVGGRTTDVSLFQWVKSQRKIVDYKTIPVGALNIYADIVDSINERYTQSFRLEDGEDILKNGLFLFGEYKDISFVKPLIKKQFDIIMKELNLSFNLDQGYVLLTGGGSLMLRKAFENRMANLLLSDDPIYDNAIGFKKVGESIWQER